MRILARSFERDSTPPFAQPYLSQLLVTAGSEYEVHALAVFEGTVFVQVIDDLRLPSWRPTWFFKVVESTIPDDWACSMFREQPTLVIGPKFISESIESYAAMVELQPSQVDRFWRRVNQCVGPAKLDAE